MEVGLGDEDGTEPSWNWKNELHKVPGKRRSSSHVKAERQQVRSVQEVCP